MCLLEAALLLIPQAMALRGVASFLMNLTNDPNLHPLCHASNIFKSAGLKLLSAARLSHDHRSEGFEDKLFAFVSVSLYLRNIVTQGMLHSTVHGQVSARIPR